MKFLYVIVEDVLSEAVMRRILGHCGFTGEATFRNTRGNGAIKIGIPKYKEASRVIPHLVFTDLDLHPCPVELLTVWGVTPLPATMLFRIAVRESEAWLLSDRVGIATYFNVAADKVPHHPEDEDNPKQAVFNLVRKCRRKRLVEEMIPKPGAHIGPLYNDHMCDFAMNHWNIAEATENAPALTKALIRISAFLAANA